MQTNITESLRQTPAGAEAEAILRKCVHCGFCLATCPTYQVLGNELDSPRGRIYLIKEMLEGNEVTARTQLHLDRCLTCLACETTCPSGVEYGRLLDIGREHVEEQVPRRPIARIARTTLRKVLVHERVFATLVRLGLLIRPLLPRHLRRKLPSGGPPRARLAPRHSRQMLLLDGCVQPALAPSINAAAARVLDRIGISLLTPAAAGCCGAIAQHMSARQEALDHARRNVDAWWPYIEQGAEALVVTASGCGPTLKEYGRFLRDDARYASRAAQVAARVKDISEVIAEHLDPISGSVTPISGRTQRVAFHAPCTLQHALRVSGSAERVLRALGFELVEVTESHLCCGSAGTYSMFQRSIADELLRRKIEALQRATPDMIATANIGCLVHLKAAADVPVVHWVELVAERLRPSVAR
jgi:glycolate oxidase iron-sulfur subunit